MVTLFTRPRRFGKTLAINMLKTFFEKTEEDTSRYFADRKIWECGEKYRAMQGKYPVIMLTFKDVKYGSFEESMEAVRLVLKDEYKRHGELKSSTALGPDDKAYLDRMEKGTLSDVEYSRALLNLTRMLSAHYGSRTIILIDEYDTPIQQGYSKGFYQEIISFMRNFLSGGLKDNENLAFGVLTGIMRVSKEAYPKVCTVQRLLSVLLRYPGSCPVHPQSPASSDSDSPDDDGWCNIRFPLSVDYRTEKR